MNRGLLAKAWRETWPVTVFCGLGVGLTEAVEAYASLAMKNEISAILSQFGHLEKLLRTFVGASPLGQFGPDTFPAIAWAHPLALILMWTHTIAYCTRIPAGEVDRGTIDVLIGLPVSRRRLYLTETFAWLVSGAALLLMWGAGNRLGNALAHGPRIEPWRLAALLGNLFCLYVAVGGLAWLASALSDRRGRAVGVVLAFVVFFFLVNYLAPFWSLAERLSFLSVLHYYVPLKVLQGGVWPARDMVVLGVLGATLWTAGGIIFGRRDLATL